MRKGWLVLGVAFVSVVLAISACGASGGDDTAGPSLGGKASGGSGGKVDGGGSGGTSASGGSGGGGTGGGVIIPDAPPPDQDSDDDGDGKPNKNDPINDGDPPTITLTGISTTFNSPIGIDYHEPTNSVVVSVNYPTGTPSGFELIAQDGTHQQFSALTGLTDEVKIATARSKNPAGFTVGDLFVGNGVDGQIVRITDNGQTVINPWVDLPGDNNGLMRGSLYIDRTGEFGGDLCAVTTAGEVWRVTVAGIPTKIASVGVHLEGTLVVPNKPARFGPVAGKLLAGAEAAHVLYAFSPDGTFVTYTLGVDVEDIDWIGPNENFFGVNFGTSKLLGAGSEQFKPMMGDVLLTQEGASGSVGLFRLKWDGTQVVAQPIPISTTSATVGQWEHVTFAPAGIVEIPPPPPPA